jgi:hypothetical protein
VEDEHALNVLVGGREHVHPSQQALDYAGWLADYHSAFTDGGVVACSAAWCHNLAAADAGPLRGAAFGGLLARSPLFVAGEEGGLVSALALRVGAGGGMDAALDRPRHEHGTPSGPPRARGGCPPGVALRPGCRGARVVQGPQPCPPPAVTTARRCR